MVKERLKGFIRTKAPNADLLDFGFLGGIIIIGLITAVALLLGIVDVTLVQASTPIVAALSAFAVVYNLRHPKTTLPRTIVRHSFSDRDGESGRSFGFRNFGSGCALYFQYRIILPDTGEEISKGPMECPVHLKEGEFLDLLKKQDGDRESLRTLIEGAPADANVEFHFSYESHNGNRVPRALESEADWPADDIREELTPTENPQRITVEEIRDNCLC